MLFQKNKSGNGFTLIEILIAISIILILSGIIIANIGNPTAKARDARRVTDLGELQAALEFYYEKNDYYPKQAVPNEEELLSNSGTGEDLVEGDYVPGLPVDPQNEGSYKYYYCGRADGTLYALKASFETENDALDSDYDKDWPNTDICDCNGINGDGNTDQEQNAAPYIYCIRGL